MSVTTVSNQNPHVGNPHVPPEQFRLWWKSYRSDLTLTAKQSPFIVHWWAELRPPLRAFLAHESGAADPAQVQAAKWDAISGDDQQRILTAARLMVADLKPAAWL